MADNKEIEKRYKTCISLRGGGGGSPWLFCETRFGDHQGQLVSTVRPCPFLVHKLGGGGDMRFFENF